MDIFSFVLCLLSLFWLIVGALLTSELQKEFFDSLEKDKDYVAVDRINKIIKRVYWMIYFWPITVMMAYVLGHLRLSITMTPG
jgi:hypothetical protein